MTLHIFFVNIPVIPAHFYYFMFCFKFDYTIKDIIVNHLYLLFMKNDVIKKNDGDIILEQLVRSVARNIVVSRTSAICLRVASILALPTFCIGDVERSKIYKHLLENKKTQIR